MLKIDVEGAEVFVLEGAKKLLNGKNKPRLLFIEIHPVFLSELETSPKEIKRILSAAGYKFLSTAKRDEQYHLIAISDNALV